jgi:hypothetical protein
MDIHIDDEIRLEAPLTVAPPAPAAPAGPAPLGTVPIPGKWEWMLLTPEEVQGILYDGWNETAADGDRLLLRNHGYREDGGEAVRLFAAGRCGRDPFQEVKPTPSTDAAFAAAAADRERWTERAQQPPYAGRPIAFHHDGKASYALEGTELYVSGDDGKTWKVAHTIGLQPVPRFARLLTCGPNLTLVPEVPAVWESMKPAP